MFLKKFRYLINFKKYFLKIKISLIVFFKETFIRDFSNNICTEKTFTKNIWNRDINAF